MRSGDEPVAGSPWDTHELAIHPNAPNSLRVAAGDGYFESDDGGATWRSPEEGLEVAYLRRVAIDPGRPDVVILSASTGPRSAYVSGVSDGRIYRRQAGGGRAMGACYRRLGQPSRTIAPLLAAGLAAGKLWAADERGLHRSNDGGRSWREWARYAKAPNHLRGMAVLR